LARFVDVMHASSTLSSDAIALGTIYGGEDGIGPHAGALEKVVPCMTTCWPEVVAGVSKSTTTTLLNVESVH
jgi:hypothetical protein